MLGLSDVALAAHLAAGGTIARWVESRTLDERESLRERLDEIRVEVRARERARLLAEIDGYERRLAFLDDQRARIAGYRDDARSALARLEQADEDADAGRDEHDGPDA